MSSSLVRLGAVIHLPAAIHLAIMSCALHHTDELIKVDVPVTVRVQLGHQFLHLLLAHVAAAQLAELAGVNGARVVLVYRLPRSSSVIIIVSQPSLL